MFSCQRQASRLRLSDVVTPGHSLSRDVVVNGGIVELLLAPLLLDHVLELVLELVQVGRAVDVLGGRRDVLDEVGEQRLALVDGLGVAAVVVLVGRVLAWGPRVHVLETSGRGERLLPRPLGRFHEGVGVGVDRRGAATLGSAASVIVCATIIVSQICRACC